MVPSNPPTTGRPNRHVPPVLTSRPCIYHTASDNSNQFRHLRVRIVNSYLFCHPTERQERPHRDVETMLDQPGVQPASHPASQPASRPAPPPESTPVPTGANLFTDASYASTLQDYNGAHDFDLPNYLAKFENTTRCAGWTGTRKLQIFTSKLAGRALELHTRLTKAGKVEVSFEHLVDALKKRFYTELSKRAYQLEFARRIRIVRIRIVRIRIGREMEHVPHSKMSSS